MGVMLSHECDGQLFLPDSPLAPFPVDKRRPAGSVVLVYSALPKGVKFDNQPEHMYWWSDVQFVPYKDNQLVNSVGAFVFRPGRVPLVANHNLHGLLYTMHLEDRLRVEVLRGTKTSASPNVCMHPDGKQACFVGCSDFHMMNLNTLNLTTKTSHSMDSQFKSLATSPNGNYIAVVAKCSIHVQLSTYIRDGNFLVNYCRIQCHKVCPGFRATRTYTDFLECRFSADSSLIAVGSSIGMLMVVRRADLSHYCNVIPDLYDANQKKLSNERCFDFDPRYRNRYIAFATCGNEVIITDLEASLTNLSIKVEPRESEAFELDSLKYSSDGSVVAVATSTARIELFSTLDGSLQYSLDATKIRPEDSMRLLSNNRLPKVIRMSFSTVGEHLAVSSTDGCIRVWQLPPEMRLQQLCRFAIMRYVKARDIPKLPLPRKLLLFLLRWPQ
ncbi:hypothetical protein CAPTEDRAFT_206254 [Capitella teleta]|uniref:SOCS box domain-containing protein n=1 Tax=Capitella teleta TaxID=283909 RepID=R7U2F6_CAPTE|nr:hypothetical protein CAPTEDRAFT_206254 [Capitella teleta]|eukprot:ELU00073.1 hypothetical protein CAPTEDRAFT_206254 [Capitella teleta]